MTHDEEERFRQLRDRMIEDQIRARGIQDERVLATMSKVERHLFVPTNLRKEAYADKPLPLGPQQTISQPFIVALMLETAGIRAHERVLEIGTGSGYQTALLAELAGAVYSIELDPRLAAKARELVASLGYSNVQIQAGDGYDGWRSEAPFDCILVTAAPRDIPRELVRQLTPAGRMVLPLGEDDQQLVVLSRTTRGLESEALGSVRFVPMRHDSDDDSHS